MAKHDYDWDWHPSRKGQAKKWLKVDNHFKRANIAKSKFADEKIIRAMASHSWNWGYSDKAHLFLSHLLDNPNLTPELRSWLDEETREWDAKSQHAYWTKRFGIESNSNYNTASSQDGQDRSFAEGLLSSNLAPEDAARAVLEMADHFAEQMWHDLGEQGDIELSYTNDSYEGDSLEPSELFGADEELLKPFSPGHRVTWVRKDQGLDFEYAEERVYEDGEYHFEEAAFFDSLDTAPFSDLNLGYAIGAGLQYEDLEVKDREAFEGYLETCYSDDYDMNEVSLVITSDTPWAGIRYRELSEQQEMNLVINFINALQRPYLGRKDGIAVHLLNCIARHSHTADNVRAFVLQNLSAQVS